MNLQLILVGVLAIVGTILLVSILAGDSDRDSTE